ncbi:MAG: glycosyltransferase [Thermodesulfobacteriaceae bacterium]|nr:glycosyltransferase [Thermodesulfobacteriaceae bacterium]
MLKYASLAFFLSFLICILIIKLSKKITFFITDHLHLGPQTFHSTPTPRTGGLAIFLGIFCSLIIAFLIGEPFSSSFLYIAFFSFPVFLAGFLEDLTGKLNPKLRMLLLSGSGILAFFILEVRVIRLDLPLVDPLFQIKIFSLFFTLFALVGISNAINIIDGFNGLASMVSMMILMAIAYVAYKLGDYEITSLCVISAFALLGFFLLNYPFGLIFLGDGGAYLSGFLIGIASILLVKKHPQVSAWFALMVNIYPVYETLFSIYRRKFLRKRPAMSPDALHLHSLIYQIFIKRFFNIHSSYLRNPLTSVFMWVLNAIGMVPALLFWNSTLILVLCCIFFAILYNYLYWKILKLKLIKIN